VLQRIFGANGISVVVPLNIGDATDPENFQLKVDGSALQSSIATKATSSELASGLAGKQDALSSSSSLTLASLAVGTEIVASAIKAPASSSLVLGNSSGTGIHVASSGAVGILKVPSLPLDVQGSAL